MDQATRTRFLKYLGIGAVAFLIDVASFQVALSLAGMSPYAARVVSFLAATTAAWWLNRTFTFHDASNERPERQWGRFMAANFVGGAVNYSVFVVVMATLPIAQAYPVLALAAGSGAGVFFNFTAYCHYVFRGSAGL
jgi:putative flippase GtrA